MHIFDFDTIAPSVDPPKQRVVNSGSRVTVDGYCVPMTPAGQNLLAMAAEEDQRNGFIPGCPMNGEFDEVENGSEV
jgi:hypothetical protein